MSRQRDVDAHYNLVEPYEKRKQRTAAEKAAAASQSARKLGYFTSKDGMDAVVRTYENLKSMTATGKAMKCTRHTVRRVLVARKVKILDGRTRAGTHYTDFYEFYTRIPGPLYRSIKTAARISNRKITHEVLTALAKLYS